MSGDKEILWRVMGQQKQQLHMNENAIAYEVQQFHDSPALISKNLTQDNINRKATIDHK